MVLWWHLYPKNRNLGGKPTFWVPEFDLKSDFLSTNMNFMFSINLATFFKNGLFWANLSGNSTAVAQYFSNSFRSECGVFEFLKMSRKVPWSSSNNSRIAMNENSRNFLSAPNSNFDTSKMDYATTPPLNSYYSASANQPFQNPEGNVFMGYSE